MKFEKINTGKNLISYLNDMSGRLDGRKYIFHYTRLENCVKILESGLWFLSNAKCMNDQLEYEFGDKNRWEKLFFSSFVSDSKESIGMWSMYSQPWASGVQIAIPVSMAKKWVKGVTTIKEISCETNKPTGIVLSKDDFLLFLSSVAYTNLDRNAGDKKVSWSTVSTENIDVWSLRDLLTGYIKDYAWDYEREIRIKAMFDSESPFGRVAIDIPDDVLTSVIITAGPLFEGNLEKILKEKLKKSKFNVKSSFFSNKLYLQKRCNLCERRISQG